MSKFENEADYVKFLQECGRSWGKNASFEAGHEQGYAEGFKDGMKKGLEYWAERNRLAPQFHQVGLVKLESTKKIKDVDHKRFEQEMLGKWWWRRDETE